MLSCSKAPKQSKFSVTDIREKPVDFYNGTARTSTLAPAITLLTWVPLQKFRFRSCIIYTSLVSEKLWISPGSNIARYKPCTYSCNEYLVRACFLTLYTAGSNSHIELVIKVRAECLLYSSTNTHKYNTCSNSPHQTHHKYDMERLSIEQMTQNTYFLEPSLKIHTLRDSAIPETWPT